MKPRDLLNARPDNDIERARLNRENKRAHDAALAAELRAQQRAKGSTQ